MNTIDQDALDHSLGIRFRNVNGSVFLKNYSDKFHRSLGHYLNLKSSNVRILTLQQTNYQSGHVGWFSYIF